MSLVQRIRILLRASRIYVFGVSVNGVARSASTWRHAYSAALCEDVAAMLQKSRK